MFSWWNQKKLNYIEARKEIYIPLYKQIVKTQAFKYLKMEYNKCVENNEILYLEDFDGYDHKQINKSYYDVIHDHKKKMGHAFVLGMILEFGENFTINQTI